MRQELLDQFNKQREFKFPFDFDRLTAQSGFFHDWQYQYRAYGGGVGNGKCLRFDTRIATPDGLKLLRDVETGDLVWTVSDDLKLVPRRVVRKINSGVLPETIVRLESGLSVSCSPWHPFLAMTGTTRKHNPSKPTKKQNGDRLDRREQVSAGHAWTRADALKKGDRIGVALDYPSGPPSGYSRDALFLLGVLIGDGGLTNPGVVNVTIGQEELVREVRRIVEADHLTLVKTSDAYTYRISQPQNTGRADRNHLLNWLRELGLAGCSSHTKFVPSFLFGASHEDIAAFLSGVFVTDGWVDNNYVGYCSVSEPLLDGVQALLLRLGIRSQKCRRTVKYKEGRTAFYLQISGAACVVKCAEWLRLLWKQSKLHRLIDKNTAKVPRGRSRRFVCGQVEFVRISRLTTAPEPVQMYDLEIEGTHNFIGNGIVAHNTSAGIALAFYLSVMFPKNLGFIGRWDGKELRQTTLAQFLALIPPGMIETHNTQQGYIRFADEYGGSEIVYSDLKEERYIKNFTFGWWWIDQAEEIDEDRFVALVRRLRKDTVLYDDKGRAIGIAPTYGLLTFNPEGSDHFLWKYFHPDSKDHKSNYKLYMASTFESMSAGFVTKEYVDNMLSVFPEQARKRYLEGAWDIFEGRVYPAFEPAIHGLASYKIQPWHKLYETIDHGSINPTAVGWWIWTEPCIGCGQPTRILIDEHYEGGGKGVEYHAAIIKTKRAQLPVKVALTYLDSACWARNQSKGQVTSSIHMEYVANEIHPIPGPKNWDVGFSRITRALQPCPYSRHPLTGELNAPHLYYVTSCRAFESEMLGYRWRKRAQSAQRNATDEPQDFKDHHMDALTYLEASNPQAGEVPKVKVDDSPLKRLEELRKGYNPLGEQQLLGSWMSL